MNLLNPQLQSLIRSRPTQTKIRSDTPFIEDKLKKIILPEIDVPDSFDGRDVWKGLLTPLQNQGTCGSCWAFATSDVLANRFNIQSMGLMYVELSAAKMILCSGSNTSNIVHPETQLELLVDIQEKNLKKSACFGNTLYNAWLYLFKYGTNTQQCVPYQEKFGQFGEIDSLGSFTIPEKMPICSQVTGILSDMCSDFTFNSYTSEETGTPARFYKALHFYGVAGVPKDGGSEVNIRRDIYKWGPVSTGMKIYSDFYTFDAKKDIYEWDGTSPQVGGHAIEIVGWGKKGVIPYWIIKNTWGDKWGDGGYFRMIRGNNNCEIEENIISCIPDYFYPPSYKIPLDYTWAENDESISERLKEIVDLSKPSGGIDPTTGYTRRIHATMSSTDFNRPVELDNLPDYQKWVAGIDGSIGKRNIYKATINARTEDKRYESHTLNIIIILISVLIIFFGIVFATYFIRIRHPNN